MSVHRFYLPPEKSKGDILTLENAEAYHAALVLRLKTGDNLVVLNGQGEEISAEVIQVQKKHLSARVLNRKKKNPPPCPITLFQAIPKARLIESIIQKATELGVSRIVPVLTERVITQLDDRDKTQKQEKWQEVAIEASKQCGQVWLPRVEKPHRFEEAGKLATKLPFSVVGSLLPGSRHPRVFLQEYSQTHNRLPDGVGIFVGPEGDFTEAEIQSLVTQGVHPITLGPLVLRVETAAIYAISVIQYELSA